MGWGLSEWGLSPWGGGLPAAAAGTNLPQIVLRSPAPNTIENSENAVVSVGFFDHDLDLDTASTLLIINGVTVYQGGVGFTSGYVGRVYFSAGVYIVQVSKVGGWGFDTQVTVRAYIEDLAAHVVDDTWHWNTRVNPTCYTGLNPLPVEILVQSPMSTFVELEPARKLFLDNCLKVQSKTTPNKGNKAARVLYQHAFSTELSTVQNPYNIRNKAALKTIVCERERAVLLDHKLMAHADRIRNGIQSLYSLGALPREYINSFQDYLDSTMYNYRVSLIANVIILARLTENA